MCFLKQKLGREIVWTKLDILFGAVNDGNMINHIIILAKRHIYYRKMKKLVTDFVDFKTFLFRTVKTEQIAARMVGKEETVRNKWKDML